MTGTNLTLASIATTGTQEMIVAFVSFVGGSGSAGAGMTQVYTFNTGVIADRPAPIAGSYDITANNPGATLWAVDALAFHPQ